MKEILPYVGVLALLLSVVNSLYQRRKDQQGDWKQEIKELSDKLEKVSSRLLVLETKSDIFFKRLGVSTAEALHSPHTKELDELLEKFQRDEIQSEKDLEKLKTMLREVAETDTSPMRRKYALDILTLIHVRFEIGGDLVSAMRGSA